MKPIFALSVLLALAACVDDQKAVDLGLAKSCESKGKVAASGDPARRFVTVDDVESCRGPKKDTYDETRWVLIDCSAPTKLTAVATRQNIDPKRFGPDIDHRSVIETQRLRIRAGITDLTGVQAALVAAGVPVSLDIGAGTEQCKAVAG